MATKVKTLSDNEVHGILLNALYAAARLYEESAHEASNLPDKGQLETQFKNQATDARNLAELIESAVTVNLALEA